METEKYYGLGLDLETTKKDSSIIDCELPGKLPENPSINTTKTSLLNKASQTSNYKKLNNCPQTFTLVQHNDAIIDSSLYVIEADVMGENGLYKDYYYNLSYKLNGDRKDVYLGYEDTNKIFTNKLQSIITTQVHADLDSDTSGCSAKAYLMPNDNTGALIKFSLNKCTADRIITFSYNNLPIFSIKQTYDNSGSLTPSILYKSKNTYKKYPNTRPLHFIYYKGIGYSGYLNLPDGYNTDYQFAWFGLLDSKGKADNNLEYTSKDQLTKYNQKFGCSISGLKIEILETNAYIKNTALMIVITNAKTTEVNGDFKITYDGKFLCNVKKIESDI